MKALVIAGIATLGILLGGCEEEQQYLTKYHVVLAPDSMYNCPKIQQWPQINTLTDLQVARLVVQLAEARNICASSLNSIKKFYADAAARIEGNQPKTKKSKKK